MQGDLDLGILRGVLGLCGRPPSAANPGKAEFKFAETCRQTAICRMLSVFVESEGLMVVFPTV